MLSLSFLAESILTFWSADEYFLFVTFTSLGTCIFKAEVFLSVETVHLPNFEELLNSSQIACLCPDFSMSFDFHENQQILSKQHLGFFLRFLKTFLQSVL